MPSETAIHFRRLAAGLKAAATAQQTELAFWNFPVHTCAVWSAKMALEVSSVNLWKTSEVS
jgi:trehalose-6-phosphatase